MTHNFNMFLMKMQCQNLLVVPDHWSSLPFNIVRFFLRRCSVKIFWWFRIIGPVSETKYPNNLMRKKDRMCTCMGRNTLSENVKTFFFFERRKCEDLKSELFDFYYAQNKNGIYL